MKINFKKMHGIGNDFIIIRYEEFPLDEGFGELAKRICHRHFGIGADGLLIVRKSHVADFKMEYYNKDGSRGAMCGNGIRCFSKFVYDEGLIREPKFTVETLAGLMDVKLTIVDHTAQSVKVNMGKIIYDSDKIPVISNKPEFINEVIEIEGRKFIASSVHLGVPHTVIFTDTLNREEVKLYGPLIETNDMFPEKTNVNFAKIIDRKNVEVKTWERGAGYTLACGTGASSVIGVAYRLGLVDSKVKAQNEGGHMTIEIMEDGRIFMDGPAEDICTGVYFI